MLKTSLSMLAVLVVATATAFAGDVDLENVKCIVAPRDAQVSKSADYKDAKVYFCCGGCAGKFAKDTKKYATKANQQLVSTKQYEQTGCPMSGGKLNPETAITVAGTKVSFCCNGCKSKAVATKGEKQLELIFNDKAFAKAFKKVEKKTEG